MHRWDAVWGVQFAADPASQAVSGPVQPGTDHSTAVQALRHKHPRPDLADSLNLYGRDRDPGS
jgi:hypothetical protein